MLADLDVEARSQQIPRIAKWRSRPVARRREPLMSFPARRRRLVRVESRKPVEIAGVTERRQGFALRGGTSLSRRNALPNLTQHAKISPGFGNGSSRSCSSTELSQSPELMVTLVRRGFMRSSKDHRILEEPVTFPLQSNSQIARDMEARTVIRGSYARVGNLFRIAVTIEDVESGEILKFSRSTAKERRVFYSLVESGGRSDLEQLCDLTPLLESLRQSRRLRHPLWMRGVCTR